jgi:hypothetical protein
MVMRKWSEGRGLALAGGACFKGRAKKNGG